MQQSLYKLLITHGGSKCKNPRDRVFALLGLVTPDERNLLERYLPDYNMAEDDVVLIALCHIRLNVWEPERERIDAKQLLLALGVESESRQRRLVRRSYEFDYLGDLPPSAYWHWCCNGETDDVDINNWGSNPGFGDDGFDVQNWGGQRNARAVGRITRSSRRVVYMLGTTLLFLAMLKLYQPQVWDVLVSFVLRSIARTRRLTGLF